MVDKTNIATIEDSANADTAQATLQLAKVA